MSLSEGAKADRADRHPLLDLNVARLLQVSAARRHDVVRRLHARHVALQLVEAGRLVRLQDLGAEVDLRPVGAHVVVAAHAAQEGLQHGVGTDIDAVLPDEADVRLGDHLAAAEETLKEDYRGLGRCRLEVLDGDLLLLLSEELALDAGGDGQRPDRPHLRVGAADEVPLVALAEDGVDKALLLRQEVEGGMDAPALEEHPDATVAGTGLQVLDRLADREAVGDARLLAERRGADT